MKKKKQEKDIAQELGIKIPTAVIIKGAVKLLPVLIDAMSRVMKQIVEEATIKPKKRKVKKKKK
ncbi:MAG: hypothetical protein ACTSSP_11245 [Candidatus Asgardarchaeia archaeon]